MDERLDAGLYALPRNLVLAASAGTGKTHALVGVILHLVIADRRSGPRGRMQPVDPSRIVATTFSRKAAAEIRARVTTELERLIATPSSSSYITSLRNTEGTALDDTAIARRARRALTRIGAARFGTLHSFATGIVRSYAIELGIGSRFEVAPEVELRARSEEAIAHALESRIASDPDTVRALSDAAGGVDCLVAQLRRILVQLEEDGRASRDLSLPAGDVDAIEATVRRLHRHVRALAHVPRFASAADDVIRAWDSGDPRRWEDALATLTAIPATGKRVAEVEEFAVFRKNLPGATNEEKGRRLARTHDGRHQLALAAVLVRDVLSDAEADIERLGRTRGALGFGELLRAARELLRDRPDVAEEVSSGIDALLVDEVQDTSRVQRELVQLLWARPGTREPGCVPPLSCVRETGLLLVGDRKQSIYGFRGADVSVFAELAVGLAGAPAREALGIPAGITWEPSEPQADFRALRHNRRSVPEILSFANAFSARRFRAGAPPPALFEIEYVPATEDLLVPPERIAGELRSPRTIWLRITPKSTSSTKLEEALVIAARVRAIVNAGEPRVGASDRAPRWRDIAVLATTNGMLDAMAFALAQSDIPHVVAGKSFFRAREIRDLAAMLALVIDPTDRLAALEVLRGPWASVRDETLLALTRPAEGLLPAVAWCPAPRPELLCVEDRPSVEAVSSLVTELHRCAARLGPGPILREAVRALAFESVLGAMPRGAQRVANVRKLLSIADRQIDAQTFRHWLDDASDQELAESEAATFSENDDAVRLLTVHASKGLDFPIVFVPEIGAALPRAEKGAARVAFGIGDEPNTLAIRMADRAGTILDPPSFLRAHTVIRRRDRAERQRLAYVAITRAADAMFLVGGRSRESSGDAGASSLVALEELLAGSGLSQPSLSVDDVAVPAPTIRRNEAPIAAAEQVPIAAGPRPVPAWHALPIAPTALADFDHCPRRFDLIHVLGMPEHGRGRQSGVESGGLDARAEGTLAHAVLERVPVSTFAGEDLEDAVARALNVEGVSPENPRHAAIASRVARFLSSGYARSAASGADIRREVAFVLPVEVAHGRRVVLRGSIDLVVIWPDGRVDVIDYKSARSATPDAHAFQLDVYALAARATFPDLRHLRVGLVFLGGSSGEPVWRDPSDEHGFRSRLAQLGERLVEARWNATFPRVVLARCEAIHCGFIGRCHAAAPSPTGTISNPSRVTTT